MRPRGYEEVKALAKRLRRTIPKMLAMAPQNDPFYAGSDGTRCLAEWFAQAWHHHGFTNGVHIRRVHYQLMSTGATRHDGMPYENTDQCWAYLNNASRYARYLQLVDPLAFVDRRNPEPVLFASGPITSDEPGWTIEEPFWLLPTIDASVGSDLDLALPDPEVSGYDYWETDQPYHLELWIEKTTMDDVLLPVCRHYGINFQTGAGFQSVTNVIRMLLRMAAAGKPARVFYISDFDPAGDGMPVQVARQLEYWFSDYAPEVDIKLIPLALTFDQARHYRLPRVPMKDSDHRKAGFEESYGVGAVELDALEALRPGVLAQLVTDAVRPYRDSHLASSLATAEQEAQSVAEEAWDDATSEQRDELAKIEAEARTVAARYHERLKALRDEMSEEMAPLRERLKLVRQAIQESIAEFAPDLPARPEPEMSAVDEASWLFDSQRDYLSQLEVYRSRRDTAASA